MSGCAQFAAFGATSLSLGALICTLITFPVLYNKIQAIRDEVQHDMIEFNVRMNNSL